MSTVIYAGQVLLGAAYFVWACIGAWVSGSWVGDRLFDR